MEQTYNISVNKFKSHQHSNGISTRGGRVRKFKKQANQDYEYLVMTELRAQMVQNADYTQIDSPVSLSIEFYVKIPTTINKVRLKASERRELRGKWAPIKPDLTNIIKTIEDCIEQAGIITDDKLIVKYENIEKKYNLCHADKEEHAKITLKKLPN